MLFPPFSKMSSSMWASLEIENTEQRRKITVDFFIFYLFFIFIVESNGWLYECAALRWLLSVGIWAAFS
jgi:hypothetical protein